MVGVRLVDLVDYIMTLSKQGVSETFEIVKKFFRYINKAMGKQDEKKVAEVRDEKSGEAEKEDVLRSEKDYRQFDEDYRKFHEERRRFEEEQRRKAEEEQTKVVAECHKVEQALFKKNTELAIQAVLESEADVVLETYEKGNTEGEKAATESLLGKIIGKVTRRPAGPTRTAAEAEEEYRSTAVPPDGKKPLRSVVANASPLTTHDDDVYDDAYVSLSEITVDRIREQREQKARAEGERNRHDGDWVVVDEDDSDGESSDSDL